MFLNGGYKMGREEKCVEARHNAWDKAKNVRDRIRKLEKVLSEYPEYMIPLSDIAVSYLEIDDTENAIRTYQKIIDQKDTFKLVWDNELGNAYLFTKDFEKAIKTLEKSTVFDYSQGLFLAFAYLKNGNRKKFKEQFDKWISEHLEKSFEQHDYKKYIKALFDDDEARFIEEIWKKYYDKYSSKSPYQLYCELYRQYYIKPGVDEEEFDEEDFEIPAKLGRSKFEQLKAEYLYLDRRTMFGDANDAGYDRYFELKDSLFADIIFG